MKKTALYLFIVLLITVIIATVTSASQLNNFSIENFRSSTYEEDIKMIDEGDPTTQIVIARYKEDISWLEDPPFNKYKVTCYNKGDNLPQCFTPKCNVIPLPNIGRCDHTFLYHIIENYDKLANLTIFLPASCLDSHKIKTTFKLMYLVDKTDNTVLLGKPYTNVREQLGRLFINKHVATNVVNQEANPENQLLPCPIRPFGRWYDAMFGDVIAKVVCYFGVFAVTKEHILQHPKSHYEKLIKFVDSHSNPEAGHYMERSWAAVFAPLPEECIYSAMDTYPDYFSSPGFEKY
jgi:hypothetical protein